MSVADAALMMNVLKRPDARDWTSLPSDPSDYTIGLDDGVRGLRIAFSPTLGYAKVDPEVAAAVAAAAAQLQALGAHVEAVDPGFEIRSRSRPGCGSSARRRSGRATPAQQALTDPDFRAEAELGAATARSTCSG